MSVKSSLRFLQFPQPGQVAPELPVVPQIGHSIGTASVTVSTLLNIVALVSVKRDLRVSDIECATRVQRKDRVEMFLRFGRGETEGTSTRREAGKGLGC